MFKNEKLKAASEREKVFEKRGKRYRIMTGTKSDIYIVTVI